MSTSPRPDAIVALDRFFDTLYRTRPVDATFIGFHDHDDEWPDWSPVGHESAQGEWSAVRAALTSRAPSEGDAVASGDWLLIDAALAASHCDTQLAELATSHYSRGNPSLAIGEAAFGVIGLITRDFLPASQRASWLVQRLRQVPAFLAGALATLCESRLPRAWRERALQEADATARVLEDGVRLWCRAMALAPDLATAIDAAVQRALGGVHAFTATLEQLPASDVDAAPCGEELLATCVRRGHWIDRPLDDLHREAVDRLREEGARLNDMVRAIGARDMAEVQERLASRHPSQAGYYRAFGEVWDACRLLSIEMRLVTWPEAPVRYGPIPEWTRMAAPALYYLYYRSPAPLDPWSVHDYVVPPIEALEGASLGNHLRTWNDSSIKLNHVVHHGALGHHVQNWYACRSPSRIGRVAAADCANRIAMIQGGTMAEGWACYATDLMEEAGFLTPDESVAEQHTRVRMLARAINDLEFHRGRRSFADSVRFYVDDVGMSAGAARAEAVKNSMFPGTAMMYWLGTQGIHDLRREMAHGLGNAFDLQAFHDTFLSSGSIPVALNARLMRQGHADAARRP
jgi:uncharacterized protein (DUF885 family)